MKYLLLTALAAFALVSCAEDSAPENHSMLPPAKGTPDGRQLFLKNCAHCHGANAHGDDGPDLHNLDWTDEQIAKRIRTGKKGQMTSFEGKLTTGEITALVAYVQSLK
ncbi:MAG: cytochrome c [Verrucomicrobiae bacterium]|nr:cytochrome c [Verrucomicrobiae bacterium]